MFQCIGLRIVVNIAGFIYENCFRNILEINCLPVLIMKTALGLDQRLRVAVVQVRKQDTQIEVILQPNMIILRISFFLRGLVPPGSVPMKGPL